MEKLGIVRRSNSPWASPLHMVPKSDGGCRPCGDYRRLNDATIPDRYPVPHVQDFSARLAGKTVFSKVDLIRGDIISVSREQHLTHLRFLFDRLSQHGLIINPAKCQFGLSTLDFLGHRIAPDDLSSDRGSQFTSELWAEVARALGVRLHHTTAFHPQANGLCERFHRSMKAALRASLKDDSWTDRLPWVLLGLHTAPKEDLQSSSAELVFGQALRVPGDFIPEPTTPWVVSSQRPALLNKANAFKPVPTSQHGLPRAWIPTDLSTAQYVFIHHNAHRSPLKPPYDGPFRVMETGDKTFIVDVGGKPERITVDRLKPAHQALDQPVVPATAPRKGRPPSIRPTRAAQVPSPDVAPQTTAATLPRTRAGREIKAPVKLMLPVFVNSGGACVGDTYT
ncbi:hypothetical protein AAFF_G00357390 [Aldrovandia affinis]|uniref:Integrase catalytic domain-containing protein n=1 Tax=Aldrovandia affinis TaxID=143900 RepID=A0AAD7TA98_9TELE|nr:hypothetical protein AAFF_G00357390 [Aldrovandia affinis]